MRTDLIFARNLDELRRYRRRRGQWVLALLVLLVLAGAGTWGYRRYVRDDPRAELQRLLPWLKSKGRALAGRECLRPLLAVIERSDLSPEDKVAGTNYLTEIWTFAEATGGEIVSREDVINEVRRVVESRSGLFYALLWLAERDWASAPLTDIEKQAAGRLFREAAEGIRRGGVAFDAVARLRADVHAALIEMGAGRDAPANADLVGVRALLATAQIASRTAKAASADVAPANVAAEFAQEVEAMRRVLEAKKRQHRKE